ncbi:hypothetical protein R1sor_020638 [Riccia sorocarpa]|uniref:DUF220 domain-containing protein n=1 Tax=Riccia sorocarpa TaxID=122646 RepID=A0ABD3GGI5_9MARC
MTIEPLIQDAGRYAAQWWQGAQNFMQEIQSSVRGRFGDNQPGKVSLNSRYPQKKTEASKSAAPEFSDAIWDLEPWIKNPTWEEDVPIMEVTVPEGSLCQLSSTFKVGLPPSVVFDILADPANKRVFKNIKEVKYRKVLEDYGHRQIVELEQAAIWRFLWLSGTLSVCVRVDQDRRAYSLKYNLAKEGFMKRFEGSWNIQPLYVDMDAGADARGRIASLVHLQQVVQPAMMPPPPLAGYVRGITRRQTEKLLEDLQEEGRRLREGRPEVIQILEAEEKAFRRAVAETQNNYVLRRHWKLETNSGGLNRRHRRRRPGHLL